MIKMRCCNKSLLTFLIALHMLMCMPFAFFSCTVGNKQKADHTALVDSIIKHIPKNGINSPEHYLDSAYQYFTPGPGDIYKKYNEIRNYYHGTQKTYDSAIIFSDSMLLNILPAYAEGGYTREYMEALFFKGDALLEAGRYDAAFALYYQAKTILLQKLKDSLSIFGYYTRLSYGYYKQRNYPEAIKNYTLTLNYLTTEKDPYQRFLYTQMHLDDIGLCYTKMGLNDSALAYFNKTIDYINNTGPQFKDNALYMEMAKAVVYGNMARVLMNSGNDSAAERYMKEGIRINSQPMHAPEDAEYTREKLAGLYLKQKRIDEAQGVLNVIKKWVDSNDIVEHRSDYYKLQAEANYQNQQYSKAYSNITAYLAIHDSMDAVQRPGAAENIQKQLDYMERTRQLAESRQDQKLQKLYTVIAIAGFLMVVIIALLVFKNYRQSKKNVTKLLELNNQVGQKNTHLQKALDALEKSHQENSRMMKIIAHDLRNPVGAMLTFTEMQLNGSLTEQEKAKMLAMLQKTGKDALSLIEDLLYSNASQEELYKENLELDALLQYCVDQLQPKAAEKKQVIFFYPKAVKLPADREKLWRVFSNLLTNAIKFSRPGDAVKVKMKVDGNNAVIIFEDKGIGIPASIGDKIFDVTADIRRKGTGNEPSFGLGLYISRQIIEAHGGRIWFESQLGMGSVFYVSLPLGVE
jgi:signal transduction histidine kinase